MKTFEEMIKLFEEANKTFLVWDQELIWRNVSERTLCGALMIRLHDLTRINPVFCGYHVDVEYNRNREDPKQIYTASQEEHSIFCDIILHSRAKYSKQDNLIAIEMKKSDQPEEDKQNDRERLKALTTDPSQNRAPIETVCGYVLGVYYEVDIWKGVVMIEYYRRGQKAFDYTMKHSGNSKRGRWSRADVKGDKGL